MILDNKDLWNAYNALTSEKEKDFFLKKYLLNLPPEDLSQYLLDDIDTLGINMIDIIAKGNVSNEQSQAIDKSLDNIINNFEQARPIAKAA